MLVKKLAILALLVLYCVTGSAAAFAAHEHCDHRPSAPVLTHASEQISAVERASSERSANEPAAHGCDGLCHLLAVADLHTDADLHMTLRPGPTLVSRPAARWPARVLNVPTPPPDVV